MTMERIPTGVVGLDRMLRGGFLPGTVVLVRGAPGTGKTSLAFQFLINGAQQGETGLFITFEEFPESLYRDAASLGFDLAALERQGKLHIIFTSPLVLLESLQDPNSTIYRRFMGADVRRAVLDSATHFTRLTDDRLQLRQHYTTLVNSLFQLPEQHLNLTLFVTLEERSHTSLDAIVIKQNPCLTSVFGRNERDLTQNPQCTQGDIFQISDGGADDVESAHSLWCV